MSVRSDPKEMSPGMQQALLIPQDVMRTAAQHSTDGQLMAPAPAGTELALAGNGVGNEQHLAQANEFNTSNPNHPLKRTVVINIRSSLADLCLKKSRATWSPPSAEATKAILQQRKFVDLQGTSEQQGDLKSIVLHKMALRSQQSTYPIGAPLPLYQDLFPLILTLIPRLSQRSAYASLAWTMPPSRRPERPSAPLVRNAI
jgi:hypothetical protein